MSSTTASALREEIKQARNPIVAGIFYPSERQDLAEEIDRLLTNAGRALNLKEKAGTCSAIISPHGSLDYSGAIAAKAWSAAADRSIQTIVLLSPSHRNFEAGIFMPESYSFSLPTATFHVDRAAIMALLHSSTSLNLSDIPHFEEHSIEMQLIFAARSFSKALILPIIASGVDDTVLDALFSHLHYLLRDKLESTLFVLTTNLAVDTDADRCLKQSASFVEAIEKSDVELVASLCDSSPSFCGGKIVAAYLRSAFYSGKPAVVYGLGSSVALAEEGEPIVGYAALGFPG